MRGVERGMLLRGLDLAATIGFMSDVHPAVKGYMRELQRRSAAVRWKDKTKEERSEMMKDIRAGKSPANVVKQTTDSGGH